MLVAVHIAVVAVHTANTALDPVDRATAAIFALAALFLVALPFAKAKQDTARMAFDQARLPKYVSK